MKNPNEKRVKSAEAALDAHARHAKSEGRGSDKNAALTDLLTNLRHWCDQVGVNFEHAAHNSENHHAAEVVRLESFGSWVVRHSDGLIAQVGAIYRNGNDYHLIDAKGNQLPGCHKRHELRPATDSEIAKAKKGWKRSTKL